MFKVLGNTYSALFTGSFGQPAVIRAAFASGDWQQINIAFSPFFESLVQSTPYILAGLAVALGFRVGLFNIGAEGQIFVGALAAVWAGTHIHGLPAIIHAPLALLIGGLGGALWGFIPGWLKAKTGAHEVINTIMMNYIAFRLSEYLLTGVLKDPTKVPPDQRHGRYSCLAATPVPVPQSFPYWFLCRVVDGLPGLFAVVQDHAGFPTADCWAKPECRALRWNEHRQKHCAGDVTFWVAGRVGRRKRGSGCQPQPGVAFSSGYGFDSIALALLGNSHPLGVVLASLLFGFLRNGALRMQLQAGIPIDIISIMQAAILAFIAAPGIIRTIYRLKEPKETVASPVLSTKLKEQ